MLRVLKQSKDCIGNIDFEAPHLVLVVILATGRSWVVCEKQVEEEVMTYQSCLVPTDFGFESSVAGSVMNITSNKCMQQVNHLQTVMVSC